MRRSYLSKRDTGACNFHTYSSSPPHLVQCLPGAGQRDFAAAVLLRMQRQRQRHCSGSMRQLYLLQTLSCLVLQQLPDAANLTAIVQWKQPQDALNLHAFLGLTSYFRDLIKDYAKVEKVLRDLVKLAELPAGAKK
jgi:hypothetical protein